MSQWLPSTCTSGRSRRLGHEGESMAAIAETGPSVTFAVERFGWVGDDRLEIAGRWFGLRGHRFLRPTLDVEVHDGHRRLLALLEHKPWAADDGEEWVAAFGWEGQPLELFAAELAVGPDLTVELPSPQGGPPVARPDTAASRSPGGPGGGPAARRARVRAGRRPGGCRGPRLRARTAEERPRQPRRRASAAAGRRAGGGRSSQGGARRGAGGRGRLRARERKPARAARRGARRRRRGERGGPRRGEEDRDGT